MTTYHHKLLQDRTSVKMIDTLIDRQNEKERCKKSQARMTVLLVAWTISFIAVLAIKMNHLLSLSQLTQIMQDGLLRLLFFGFVACLIANKIVKDKSEMAEDEFEALRLELIERNSELWPTGSDWDIKAELYNWLEQQYDINLYHK